MVAETLNQLVILSFESPAFEVRGHKQCHQNLSTCKIQHNTCISSHVNFWLVVFVATRWGLETAKAWAEHKVTTLFFTGPVRIFVFLYGSETWVIRKTDNEKIQCFQWHHSGEFWASEGLTTSRTLQSLIRLVSMICRSQEPTVVTLCSVTSSDSYLKCLHAKPYNSALTLLVESFLHKTGDVHVEHASSKEKKTWGKH